MHSQTNLFRFRKKHYSAATYCQAIINGQGSAKCGWSCGTTDSLPARNDAGHANCPMLPGGVGYWGEHHRQD